MTARKIDPEPITIPLAEEGCKLPRRSQRTLGCTVGTFPIAFCPFLDWRGGKRGTSYTARCTAFGARLKRRAADVSYLGDVFRCGACKKLNDGALKIVVEGR